MSSQIERLHHNAYRCRDSEETRAFYEDFLGLRLALVLQLAETKTGRAVEALHTFYELDDGSFLAFFEVPGEPHPYGFPEWHDFDLHIALKVPPAHLEAMLAKGREAGMDVRGPTDHGIIRSIYFRDPNGYVVELTHGTETWPEAIERGADEAHAILDRWQARKRATSA